MNRVELALRTFFWIFFKKEFRDKIAPYFDYKRQIGVEEEAEEKAVPVVLPQEKKTRRSDAVGLLALLQREGRLVDFFKEPIDSYSDAQIGAAVRDVHKDCAAVLERVFDIIPLVEKEEGTQMPVLPGFDPDQIRLTGNVAGNPPYNGILRHCGWKANRCELPLWQGAEEAVNVVAPAEVELN
ncbi:MAG: DUF2760 domain-containing protein [Chitinispirillales bacterium]|jgi:hypothetical protein|nr:DUF2760 domain-containing protein [Chitinispirillales bacterium]